jgi:hypothetical protein
MSHALDPGRTIRLRVPPREVINNAPDFNELLRRRRFNDSRDEFLTLEQAKDETPDLLSYPKLIPGAIVKLNFQNLSENEKGMFNYYDITEDSIGIITRPLFQRKIEVLWEKWPNLPSLADKEAKEQESYDYRDINHSIFMEPTQITPTGQFITPEQLKEATNASQSGRIYYVNLLQELKQKASNFASLRKVFASGIGGKKARRSRKSRKVSKRSIRVRKSRKVRKSRRRARR